MKRFLAIFICMALLGALLVPVPGVAEAARVRVLYVRAPSSWETAYIWPCEENGENFGLMPGTKLFRDGDVFYMGIPDGLTAFTLSGNGMCTVGPMIAEPYQDLYVTIDEDDAVRVEYDGFAENEAPPEPTTEPTEPTEETYYVAGSEELCGALWEVNNPANKMTKNSDGIYTKTFTQVPQGTYQMKVTDGTWDNSWGGNGPYGNYEFTTAVAGDVTVKFDPSAKQISVDLSREDSSDPTADCRTLILKVPESWDAVYVYTWGPEYFGSFPGIHMDQTGDVYTLIIPKSMVNLFVSSDSVDGIPQQSGDIILKAIDATVTVEVKDHYSFTVSYGEDNGGNRWPASPQPGTDSPAGPNSSGSQSSTSGGSNTQQGGNSTNSGTTNSGVATGGNNTQHGGSSTDSDVSDSQAGVSDLPVTQPADPGLSAPPVTQPADPGTTPPSETPPDRETHHTLPGNEGADPTIPGVTQPSEPVPSNGTDRKLTALVNPPIQSMGVFLFGIAAVFVYLLFLLGRRNQFPGDVTPDGKVRRRTRLSAKAVTRAVKETMPLPSDKLDQSVLEAIQKAKQPPTKP